MANLMERFGYSGALGPGGDTFAAGKGSWMMPGQQPDMMRHHGPGTGMAPPAQSFTGGAGGTTPLSALLSYNRQQAGGQPFVGGGGPNPNGQSFVGGADPNSGGQQQFDWMQFLRTLGYGGMPGMIGGGGGLLAAGGQSPWNMLNPGSWGQQMPQLGAYRPQFGGAGYVNPQG